MAKLTAVMANLSGLSRIILNTIMRSASKNGWAGSVLCSIDLGIP